MKIWSVTTMNYKVLKHVISVYSFVNCHVVGNHYVNYVTHLPKKDKKKVT